MINNSFPFYRQLDLKDCGPTCLKIIAKFYKKDITIQTIRLYSETTREGSSLSGLVDASEKIGFKTLGVKINFNNLKDIPLPCIIHWNNHHFVVLYKVKKNKVFISDPAHGLLIYSKEEFIKNWIGENSTDSTKDGIALLLEPGINFNNFDEEIDINHKKNFEFIYFYLKKYKNLIIQLSIGLLIGTILTVIQPFLTQSIVDIGIQNKDLSFIYLILLAQIMLFIGKLSIDVIRGWVLLHLSTRINVSLVSDFFIKLMNLPINFFDTRMVGDIMQRIHDHNRIEKLLTNHTLSTLFSLINVIVFSIVLAYYNLAIFLIFLIGSLLYIGWILLFLKQRENLDYERFSQISKEKSKVIELINGMQEIKLHNAEKKKRWDWEFIQVKLFKINLKSLSLEQKQNVGSNFINQITNILITFMSATLVINGKITLGMMLSIQYIIGQMSSPLFQLISFIQQMQDAKISLERLSEIHNKKDEEPINEIKISEILNEDINIKKLNFRYPGNPNLVIKDLSLVIPKNKITAIVGASGSGKTTLMKLLMKFYSPTKGDINLGNINFNNISHKSWRDNCGVVMQDGYIFSDTIAYNIAFGDDYIDQKKFEKAIEVSNIKDYVESLPLSYNTKIGENGIGMSGGQKQRLMIARSIYKNPNYIFFDEATSSLDANNEKIIMKNLDDFFEGKTVVIIAHRLSTVKNADQIVVMGDGKIIEKGNHNELVKLKGSYYNLVKNQLDLEILNN